ncbi:trimethyllysine dioxygenase [Cryptococcus depauperatus]
MAMKFTKTQHNSEDKRPHCSERSFSRLSLVYALLTIAASWLVYHSYEIDQTLSGSWGCEMSWMSPSYKQLEWSEKQSDPYNLYLYREQGLDIESHLSGHPVLFIPGNAGSYQQVRSIASSAAKQFHEQNGINHHTRYNKKADFFTVDFNEDFSALHAQTLRYQADYVCRCIRRIFLEYEHLEDHERPSKVTLLGHSMGGVVARLAADSEMSNFIDIIVTMSTPHLVPPIPFEYDMDSIYTEIDERRQSENHPPLISLCGGVSDTQVASDYCSLPQETTSNSRDLAVFTTGIPVVWTGVDHQAMVWCRQICSRITNMLFEMLQHPARSRKMAVARKWLLEDQYHQISSQASVPVNTVFPIMSQNMTILGKYGNGGEYRVKQCRDDFICENVSPTIHMFPYPVNPIAPFPFPGEGTKSDEVMIAVDLNLLSSSGTIVIESSAIDWTISGEKVSHIIHGHMWKSAVTHSHLLFPSFVMSSLSTYTVEVELGQCEGDRPVIRHYTIPASALKKSTYESRYYPFTNSSILLHSHSSSIPFTSFQGQKGEFPHFDRALQAIALNWSPGIVAALCLGALIQSTLASFPVAPTILIGTVELIHLPLVAILAIWSLGLVFLLYAVASVFLWLQKMMLSQLWWTKATSEELANTDSYRLPKIVAPSVILTLTAYFTLPHQVDSNRYHLQVSIAMFMLFWLPFNVPILFVWARHMWMKWENPLHIDCNLLYVTTLVVEVVSSLNNSITTVARRPVQLKLYQWILVTLITINFFFGIRGISWKRYSLQTLKNQPAALSSPRRTLYNALTLLKPAQSYQDIASSSSKSLPDVHINESAITVQWSDGRKSEFDHFFLFDHCRCNRCFYRPTKQRLKTLSEVSTKVHPISTSVDDNGLHIVWSVPGHTSFFPFTFLEKSAYNPPLVDHTKPVKLRTLWNSSVATTPPTVLYEDIMDEQADKSGLSLLRVLDQVYDYGFCFIDNVPQTEKATKNLIELIAPIRQTHYGGFWSFTADLSHGDLAYSAQALPAHTDTTYFTDPAGLQIFHLLSHPHPGSGGKTLLVDGFYTASLLSASYPNHYSILSKVGVPYHASGTPGNLLRPQVCSPVFTHDERGRLAQVRWNNEDRGVLGQGWTSKELQQWYQAARKYEELVNSEDAQYWVKLRPGTVLVIDNWRVMHGRSAFTGSRTMCGAYVGADDWQSRRRVLANLYAGSESDFRDDLWTVGW